MDRVKYYSRFEDEIQKVVFQRPGTQGKKAGVSIDRALPETGARIWSISGHHGF